MPLGTRRPKRERQEAARKSREKREVEAEFYRQIKAAADREAKRKELVRVAISVGLSLPSSSS